MKLSLSEVLAVLAIVGVASWVLFRNLSFADTTWPVEGRIMLCSGSGFVIASALVIGRWSKSLANTVATILFGVVVYFATLLLLIPASTVLQFLKG